MRKFLLLMLVGLFSISIFGQGTIEIGTGTLTNSTIVHPTPYGTYYKNHRVQYLYLASELSAAGLLAGDITALAFNVENPNTCSDMPNFTIKGKLTTDNVLTTTFDNGTYTTLFTSANYLPSAGWNTHTFTTPITWDGTSNLLIDVCFDIIPGAYTENASVFYTVTSTNLASSFRSDSTPACGTTSSATTSVNRANIRLTGTVASCLPPSLATVVASNFSTTGVTLSWTDLSASSWNAELYLASAVYGVDAPLQTANNLSSTTWNITGLTALTNYKVYLQSNCGANGLSIFVGPYNFNTPSSSLSGVYTINSTLPTSGTNFANFTDLALALNTGGLGAPVIVNVEPNSGPYVEQVSIGQILNSSATNTVTINGNGNTLQFLSTNTNERATLKLNGASYVTVNNLIVKALGDVTGEFGWAVWLTNGANHNTFDNCEFHASTTSTLTNFAGFVTSNSATGPVTAGLAADYLTIKNSKSIGGYYGIIVNGPTSAPFSTNNLIENNEILDFSLYGLYLRGQNNSVFTDNIIGRPTRATTGTLYMLYITQNMSGSIVKNNIISDFSPAVATTSTIYGVYGTTISATVGQELLFANNVIYGMQNLNGTQYGLYMLTTNNTKFYHNTVSMDNTSHTGSSLIRAFHHSGNLAEIELVNNIFSVTSNSTGIKYCLYFAQTLANIPNLISNGNVLYMGATAGTNHIAFWNGGGGPSFTTLLDWQAAGGGIYDQTSLNADPLFAMPLVTPTSAAINNIGINLLASVPTDIFGVARTATPDPGAIEYIPASCQMPTNLSVASITDNSATLSWISSAPSFVVEVGLVGFMPGTATSVANVVNHTTNSWTATALNSSTNYHFYVKAICVPGDSSAWAGPFAFTTACGIVTSFSENFDGGPASSLPNCWAKVGSSGTTNLQTTNPFSAPNCLYIYSSTASNMAVVSMPPVSNAGANTHQLRFQLRANFTVGGLIEVGYLTDPTDATTFVAVETVTASSMTYEEKIVNLGTAPGSNTSMAFRALGVPAYSMLIDDVVWEALPSCPAPTALTATNITHNSVDLSWTSTSTAFEAEIGAVGFTPGSGTSLFNISNHPNTTWNVIGLNASTNYNFFVKAICAVGDSSTWAGPFAFTSACGPITPAWTEDFNSTPFPPICWDRYEGSLTANSTLTSSTSGWAHHFFGNVTATNNSAFINVYSTKNHWLVTPTIDLGAGTSTYRLEFDMALTPWTGQDTTSLGSTDTIAVVISTDNGVTWSDANVLLMLTENNTISNTGENVVIQLGNYTGLVRIGFYASRPSGFTPDLRFYVDNVSVLENIVITDATITPDSVTFIVNEPSNLETFVTWNSATTVTSIVDNQTTPYTLTATDYTVAGNAITINQAYLTTSLPSAGLTRLLTINFDLGNPVVLTIGSVTTVDVNELENNIVIYPNPSNGQFSIIADDTYMVSIYDISGRLIQVKEIYSGTNEINMLNNASGVYTIKIMNNKHSNSFRIVVQ